MDGAPKRYRCSHLLKACLQLGPDQLCRFPLGNLRTLGSTSIRQYEHRMLAHQGWSKNSGLSAKESDELGGRV